MTRTQQIYLDWNATTPPAQSVLAAMDAARSHAWANPSSVHGAGRAARRLIEDTRERLAGLLELQARDVVFTGGGTEANNLALAHAPGLALSRLEHPSVVRVAEELASSGRPVVWLPVSRLGQIEVDAVGELCGALPAGSWLAAMYVNHETGVVQPLEALGAAAHALGLKLHSDAVQALGKLDLGPLIHADSISVAAHKLRGPKGVGALCLRANVEGVVPVPRPVLRGGSQERGFRPGTQDAVAIAGFGAALERLAKHRAGLEGVRVLRDRLEQALAGRSEVSGEGAPRAPHVSNLRFAGWRGDELVAALDLEGICASAGSACSAGTLEPSPVLAAMLDPDAALRGVRFSLGEDTRAEDVARVIGVLSRLVPSD
ncbi:MAG: cysteine desulfurase [Polyangiaceae bacterium]|nr:cysteine desulfurase [Polyangiaceae bacterium]MCB9608400.1 cysteine desulfurase [Polyangiaceae bacterium]